MEPITGLMDALKAGGPYAISAVFIVGWWLERHDRRERETHMRAVYDKTVTLVTETNRTIDRMQSAVTALTEAIRALGGRAR